MIGSGGERWVLSALFVLLGLWYLAATVRAARGRQAGYRSCVADNSCHVLMSAAMISMLWSWGLAIPAIAQVTVFTAAAGWFAGHAIFRTGGPHRTAAHESWYHAGTMAVMVWMAVALPLMAGPASAAGNGGTAMPGMAMGGTSAVTASAVSLPALGSAGWAATACLILAAALLAAALWQATVALRPLAAPAGARSARTARKGPVPVVLQDGAGALMAAGMAVALLAMA